jgi:hypothetical protein
MKRKAFGLVLIASALALFASGAFGWEADFEPSTFNPAVGEVVEFTICEPCLGSGDFTYAWDFDADGAIDLATGAATVEHAFGVEGYGEFEVTLTDEDGRRKVARRGLLVGDVPAYAVRETVDRGDGTIFVAITIHANGTIIAAGIQETRPAGCFFELIDTDEAMLSNPDSTRGSVEVADTAWAMLDAGDERTLSYRLQPTGLALGIVLDGWLSGRWEGTWFENRICGVLEVSL